MNKDETKHFALILVFLLTASFAWYKLWVEPRDEWRWKVMECMGHESSEEAYRRCAKEIGNLN